MESNLVVFEDVPAYDTWTKYIIGGIIATTLILGIVFLAIDIAGAVTFFAITVFDAVLFRMILPKRFLVYEDRVKLVLGGPFSISIPLREIIEVRQANKITGYVYWGLRFATSSRHLVEIRRRQGLDVIISPSHEDEFIEQINRLT